MIGLDFEEQAPVVAPDPHRADITCFVGFVGRRATALPAPVRRWLREQGWTAPPYQRPDAEIEGLLNLPVPIDTWEVFDHLFAWDRRELTPGGRRVSTYLGAAVRSFFAQGGRKCYLVRAGDPWPLFRPDLTPDSRRSLRLQKVRRLIPGFTLLPEDFARAPGEDGDDEPPRPVSPVERARWRSMDHLFGLPDVSFVCLPDLADAVRAEPPDFEAPEFPPPSEQFLECSTPTPVRTDGVARYVAAPRCDERGYLNWARAVNLAGGLTARFWRETQLVAALPMPQTGAEEAQAAARDLLLYLTAGEARPLARRLNESLSGAASAFVQLAYPWARTPGSANLPEQLESPDGVLAGLLACNALTRGAFRSAANLSLADVHDLAPLLTAQQMLEPHPDTTAAGARRHALLERVSLFGPTPGGLRLLSDVTTSLDESYRPAAVNRLVSLLARAARRLGEESVFEPSGEALWTQLRERLEGLLTELFLAGALRGDAPADAFQVRCDRSTMTQNDIDNGRLIARIVFTPALPIERITVVMAMDEGGQISLISERSTVEAV
jgi:uncharacterized protein